MNSEEPSLAQEISLPGENQRTLRCAAIDIGSNSMRLVVVQATGGYDYRVLDEERISTRLARCLASDGRLDDRAIDASMSALGRFKQIAEGFGVKHIRTIATCAVREAKNGEEFCRRAKNEIGIDIDVISAEQEGQLAFRSVARAFDIRDMNVAIADIGGGSTEVVFAVRGHIDAIIPTPLGCVRVSEVHGLNDSLFATPESMQQLIRGIDKELKQLGKQRPFVPQVLIGTGGTFTSLASMLMMRRGEIGQVQWGYRVHRADVSHMLDMLGKMTLKQRKSLPGLSADRADIIVAGIAVIDRLMHRLDVNTLRIHDRGVRDGLILQMLEELQSETAIGVSLGGAERWVGDSAQDDAERHLAMETFAKSCGVDLIHTRHVAELAVQLYRQLVPLFDLPPDDENQLRSAAMLQDVGYLINYEKHHKHSYDLIINSQLPGFTRQSLEIVANVARYHRGAGPKRRHSNFSRLSEKDQQRVRRMAAVLRIAGALDRSHRQQVTSVQVTPHEGYLWVEVESTGDVEVDLWSARGRTELFEKAFEKDIRFGLGDAPTEN